MMGHVKRLIPTRSRSAYDADAIRAAYRRWAGVYDLFFGNILTMGRQHTLAEVNRLAGTRVLDVGVGTGLALPYYDPGKRVTGIDLSAEMLERARARAAAGRLKHVEVLLVMDAEATSFAPASFDIAVAMYVASVAPNPRRLIAEMRRVVRPGGSLLILNHFVPERGPRWWLEGVVASASRKLGWRSDFRLEDLLSPAERAAAHLMRQPPVGLFTLVRLTNDR
jgi:phosphatidylethanolamine/phosphatidyl-N-methylethanolamine N-methyltransferase